MQRSSAAHRIGERRRQVVGHVDERAERARREQGFAAPVEAMQARRIEPCEMLDQRGLADARLAAHGHARACSRALHGVEYGTDAAKLGLALQQRRNGQPVPCRRGIVCRPPLALPCLAWSIAPAVRPPLPSSSGIGEYRSRAQFRDGGIFDNCAPRPARSEAPMKATSWNGLRSNCLASAGVLPPP